MSRTDDNETVTRRSVLRKTGFVASGMAVGTAASGNAAAGRGDFNNGGSGNDCDGPTERYCAQKPDFVNDHGKEAVPPNCADLTANDLLIAGGVCTLWIGAAAADGFPGDEAIAWKVCGAGTVICGLQRKLANKSNANRNRIKQVQVYEVTDNAGQYSKGDTVLAPR